ncbi:hypothetical protein R0J93_25405, partial [Pseudoalteromonas sp. SIMBA_148]
MAKDDNRTKALNAALSQIERQFGKGDRYRRYRRPTLHGWRAGLATLACLLPLLFGFLLPVG